MTDAKFRIYDGIVCLETSSSSGHLWWDQGYGLGYMPYAIKNINQVKFGTLTGSNQTVLAVQVAGLGLIAVNLPRSDIAGLEKRGLWPNKLRKPYSMCVYTPWPERLA